jgi:hypothetical protein
VRAIFAWFGSTLGKVVAIFAGVMIVILVWKWQAVYDRARGAWWGLNNAQVVTHTANADTAVIAARADSVAGAAANAGFEKLLVTPEIRNNPGAQRVGTAAKTVIASKNSEIGHLKTAVVEQKAATKAAVDAGEKPVPRISPYADIGYARSFTRHYGVPVVRAGVDYRVVAWAHVQAELSYEPPPAPRVGFDLPKDAEIRGTLTAHIVFR